MLIRNAMILDMTGTDPYVGDILIKDGKIAQIGAQIQAPEEKEVIEADGLWALPGFVDAHTHQGGFDMIDQNGMDLNEMTDPVTPQVRAIDGCNPLDKNFQSVPAAGVTTLCITPGSGNVVCGQAFVAKSYGNDIHDMAIKNPCAVKVALGMNPKGVYGPKGKSPMTRMGIAAELDGALKAASDYRSKKEKAVSEGKEPPAYNEKWEAILPALEGKIPLKIHCEQFDMLTAIEMAKKYGCRLTIEHAWLAKDFLDELAESGACINYGPVGVPTGYGELTGADLSDVALLDRLGVNVSIISDSPILSEDILLVQAGEAVRCGVTPERALRMITINPAKALGVEDRVGSLEVGKDGDVVLFNAFPARDVKAQLRYTIIEGRIVFSSLERS
ncbi:amidohydrolase family protein [Roseburia hominis]